jgi:hypothetical protein
MNGTGLLWVREPSHALGSCSRRTQSRHNAVELTLGRGTLRVSTPADVLQERDDLGIDGRSLVKGPGNVDAVARQLVESHSE